MQSVRQDFAERVGEIDKFFNLLENIIERRAGLYFPDDTKRSIDVELSATLKSAGILILYNLIESVVTNTLSYLHEIICSESVDYANLRLEIKQLWLSYYYKVIKEERLNDDHMIDHIKAVFDICILNQSFSLPYEDFSRFAGPVFSGNLDAKEIRRISQKYGISFNAASSQLKTIKELRNKLAHGEVSFKDCCNQSSMQYMNDLKEKSVDFMSIFIDTVDSFIVNKEYRDS